MCVRCTHLCSNTKVHALMHMCMRTHTHAHASAHTCSACADSCPQHRQLPPQIVLAAAVSSAEDPEKLLDQVVQEMQGDLIRMRQAAAQVNSHYNVSSRQSRRTPNYRELALAHQVMVADYWNVCSLTRFNTSMLMQVRTVHTGHGVSETNGGQVQASASNSGECAECPRLCLQRHASCLSRMPCSLW